MKVSTKQLTETVAPVVEPVSDAEMKTHLRVDTSDSDTLIGVQTIAARQWVEKQLQMSLVQRTYRADLWAFADVMELPVPPLSSVTDIKYYNTDSPEVLTTLSTDVYRVNTLAGYIYRAQGESWPSWAYRHDAVQITFVTGFEPSGSPQDFAGNVPEAIKAAIKLQTGDLFENRESNSQLRIQELPTVTKLLAAYREY